MRTGVIRAVDLTAYLIADRPSFLNEKDFFQKVEKVVNSGISCVQFRDLKNSKSQSLETARQLKKITGKIPLFVNTTDSLSLIEKIDACGIFLESKSPVSEIRKILGTQKIIGIPVTDVDDIIKAENSRFVDYVSIKIFQSKKTSQGNMGLTSLNFLSQARKQTQMKIVAIGGINMHNLKAVLPILKPGDGVAMASGFLQHPHPDKLVSQIKTGIV